MIDRPDSSDLALALLLSQVHPRAMVALGHAKRTLPEQLGHDLGGHFSKTATSNVSNEEILIEIRNIKPGDNKGAIRADMRCFLISTDVRRHRLISRDSITTVTAEAAGSSPVVPAISSNTLGVPKATSRVQPAYH